MPVMFNDEQIKLLHIPDRQTLTDTIQNPKYFQAFTELCLTYVQNYLGQHNLSPIKDIKSVKKIYDASWEKSIFPENAHPNFINRIVKNIADNEIRTNETINSNLVNKNFNNDFNISLKSIIQNNDNPHFLINDFLNYVQKDMFTLCYQQKKNGHRAGELKTPREAFIRQKKEETASLVLYNPNPNRAVVPLIEILNKELLRQSKEALEDNEQGLFQSKALVPYHANALTYRPQTSVNELAHILNDAKENIPSDLVFPASMLPEQKPEWIDYAIKRKGSVIGTITYLGRDENGNDKFEFTIPTNKLKQNVYRDEPEKQMPLPNIAINQQIPYFDPKKPETIDDYYVTMVANQINASYTKIPYLAPPWTKDHANALAERINSQPDKLLPLLNQRAQKQATAITVPEQMQVHIQLFQEKLAKDPLLNDKMIDHLIKLYFASNTKISNLTPTLQFLKYWDSMAPEEEKNTPENLKKRLTNMSVNGAFKQDMINTFVNSKYLHTDFTRDKIANKEEQKPWSRGGGR